MNEIRSVLGNRNFLRLWTSQVLSQLTVNILSFVILLRLYETTGSPVAASIMWIAYALPAIIVGPFAAAGVDLLDRRKVLMIATFSQAVIILIYSLILFDRAFFLSYVVVFLYSFFNQFYVPAEAASLPTYVEKEKLASANGLFFITQQSALVVGFGLGGFLAEALGTRPTVFIGTGTLLIAFLSVSFLPKKTVILKLPSHFEDKVGEFFDQILQGYRFIKNTKKVLLPFILLLGIQVVLAVIVTNLPPIATEIVGIKATSSGVGIVVPAGIGALIATFTISTLLARGIRKRKIILIALLAFALNILIISVFLPLISVLSIRVTVGVVLFMMTGFSVVAILVPSITFLQVHTPKDLLGRVFGYFWFLTTIATIIPIIFSATITEILGVRTLFGFLGAFCAGAFMLAYNKVKEI